MGLRHVLGHGGVGAGAVAAHMLCDASPTVVDGDGGGASLDLDPGADQAVGHGVVVGVDLEVLVDVDAGFLHLGVAIRDARQGFERRSVETFEEFSARAGQLAEGALVEVFEQLGDGGVELGEGEEGVVAKTRQDPSLDDLYCDLDLCFITGPTTCTATSTFALSRGRRGRAGKTATAKWAASWA